MVSIYSSPVSPSPQVSISPDNTYVVAGSSDGGVFVYRTDDLALGTGGDPSGSPAGSGQYADGDDDGYAHHDGGDEHEYDDEDQ